MRWNCPHCDTPVTVEIDFENTKQAYVRCAKCEGVSLVHRSAALAETMKARRLESEARALQEKILAETKREIEKTLVKPEEVPAPPLTPTASLEASDPDQTVLLVPAAEIPRLETANETIGIDSVASDWTATAITALPTPTSTPPPFTAAPQIATPPRPPAFLLKENTATVTAFAEIGEEETIAPMTAVPKRAKPASSIAVWVAAALAMASGIYLYIEGKKALAPSAVNPPTSATTVSQAQNRF